MVWLLLAVFTMPVIVKTTHIYSSCILEKNTDNSHSQHDCNTCLICKFAFTAFTGDACIYYDFSVIHDNSKQDISACNKSYKIFFVYYGLRAPPMA
jgi:hypothetical protein